MVAFEYQSKEEKEVFDEETFDKILLSLSEISYLLSENTIRYNDSQKAISEQKNNMKGNIHQIVSNGLAMAVALSIIVGIPVVMAHRIKNLKMIIL